MEWLHFGWFLLMITKDWVDYIRHGSGFETTPCSIARQINNLKTIKNLGIIGEEEFKAKVKEILDL